VTKTPSNDGTKPYTSLTVTPQTFDATVDFNTANPNTGGTVFTPNTPASTTVLYVSSIDGSQWTYNGTTYVTGPVSDDWKVTGNAGTNTANNFIGTTDNVGLSFRTNNVIRQTISNSGNVGIGTTVPTSKLNIAGGGVKIASGFPNNASRPALNNVAIGNYEIRGVGGAGTTSQVDAADDGFLRLSAGGGTSSGAQASIDISGFSSIPDMNNNIVMRTAGVERVRVNILGNVGIGTTTPTSTLHIQGSEAGSVTNITGTTTLNATHHKVLVSNGATAITITFPNALTCLGREYVISRAAGSTGVINVVGSAGNQIQALTGTIGASTSIGLHSATGVGLRHSFTAINIGGVGTWVRL